MAHFCISLPGGVRVSPRAYLAALRLAMANPTASFKQSFNDPTGWMGGHTGASIVREWQAMLEEKWTAKLSPEQTAERAFWADQHRRELERERCCKWCGQQVGRDFCDGGCYRAYYC